MPSGSPTAQASSTAEAGVRQVLLQPLRPTPLTGSDQVSQPAGRSARQARALVHGVSSRCSSTSSASASSASSTQATQAVTILAR